MLFDSEDKSMQTLRRFQQKLTAVVSEPMTLNGVVLAPVPFTVSIGVCTVSAQQPLSLEQLLQSADKALYQVKANGKNDVIALPALLAE